MTFDEVKKLLAASIRSEMRDHAFGDAEVFWSDINTGEEVATGYFSGKQADVYICSTKDTFMGDAARELRRFGKEGAVNRNDETGPDTYSEGILMPGLTLEGVRDELTS